MTRELDGARILSHARDIAFPRYPGTEGDRRAIEIVARKLEEAGLEVVEESFSYDIRLALRALRVALVATALLVAASGLVAGLSVTAALALLAVGLLSGGLLVVWAPGAERLYERPGLTSTSNVTGRRPAEHPRMTLILLAHHDSKSQNLTFPVRMGLTMVALLSGVALAALLVVEVVARGPVWPAWLAPVLGLVSASCLFVLSTLRSGNESPGGVDNAGSVGIVLELARVLPQHVGADVELVFLSPGAEEDHMVGAMRWLAAHRGDLEGRPVYALNFDGAGAPGKTVLIERYGLGRAFAPTVSAAARAAAHRLRTPLRSILMLPAMGVDAIPFVHHGVECLTFASGRLDRATMSVHSSRDVADNLDAETLERVARLGCEVALELCATPGPRA